MPLPHAEQGMELDMLSAMHHLHDNSYGFVDRGRGIVQLERDYIYIYGHVASKSVQYTKVQS